MSKKFDWRSLVGTVAPTIATALGGPMAGMAVKGVASALGINPDGNDLEGQIEVRLESASHEDLLALKAADNDFKLRMRELDIKEADLHFKDMADARANHKDSWEPFVIFCVMTVISASGFWFVVGNISDLGDATKGMLLPLFGAVVYKWLDCIAYFVGTTRSSARKTSLLSTPK